MLPFAKTAPVRRLLTVDRSHRTMFTEMHQNHWREHVLPRFGNLIPANRQPFYNVRRPQQWQQGKGQPYSNSRFTGRPRKPWGPPTSTQSCSQCGRVNDHPDPLFCPMMNKECFTCGKRGHSFKLCRSNGFQYRQNY
jgi:hypothetical protein